MDAKSKFAIPATLLPFSVIIITVNDDFYFDLFFNIYIYIMLFVVFIYILFFLKIFKFLH
jgi:hypothetical protein